MKKQLAMLSVLSVMAMGCAHAADTDFTKLVRPDSMASVDAISGDHMVADAPCDDEAMAPSTEEVATGDESGVKKGVENAYDKTKAGAEKAGKNVKEGAKKAGDNTKKEMNKIEDKMKRHKNDSSCK